MARISLLSVSLAAKCRLLFGLAVLLIIAAALFVPWLRMRDLVHESNLQAARWCARLAMARSDLHSGNWRLKQSALDRWWPAGIADHGLQCPTPRLIDLSDSASADSTRGLGEFTTAAIQLLAQRPGLSEAPPMIERVGDELAYRLVLPVRSMGGQHPAGTLIGAVAVEYPSSRARVDLLTNFGLSLMAGALAGILAVLVFYLITHKLILSPVRELTHVAEIVSLGRHSVRSQIATGDEFEELARALNAMLSHLEVSETELRTINASLDTRVGELTQRNIALFEANKLKNQFLANVSHELRTPLTSIIGFGELLREAASTEGGRLLRYSENIMSSGRMLLGIINDLLDLARIEAGKIEIHLVPVNLPEMIRDLADFMRPLAEKKNLQLSARMPDVFPEIISDSGRIQQILYNLASNAVKFTPDGGLVEISLRQDGDDHVCVAVRDSGVGIAEEDLPLLFEKFRQLDGSVTREHGGTGLGLAISKELAAVLGGFIGVTSRVGAGSTFTVTLPTKAPAMSESAAAADGVG